jgi:phosphohistidine swiveling domain-containing protein
MKFVTFEQTNTEHQYLGGKAYALGLMKNAGFPVPVGATLTSIPENEEEWSSIFSWWKAIGRPKLAVRSSAQGEDSGEQSFAGQNSTFLNIDSESTLKKAIIRCFESFNKKSSELYREHFLKEKSLNTKMNVVLQQMVTPKYSGVFFSIDPRTEKKHWVLEAISGYGEELVSGHQTPLHFTEIENNMTSLFDITSVVKTGLLIKDFFHYEVDMEWAIDEQNQFYVLQARPITALDGKSKQFQLIQNEIDKLKNLYSEDTIWDGQTFAEFNGPPTQMTFSLWREAFSANKAFSKALKKIGYVGIDQEILNESHSLLESIFSRAYINISMMAPLYFGPIPYKMESRPIPHLTFDYKKMTFSNFIQTPLTMWKMIKVGWRLSTERRNYLNDCKNDLLKYQHKNHYLNIEDLSLNELVEEFKTLTNEFTSQTLINPLILIILIESTSQSLKAMLKGVVDDDAQIDSLMRKWMSSGLHTESFRMQDEYKQACLDLNKRESFLKIFGHRGPGELELSHPRWKELQEKTFVSSHYNTKSTPNRIDPEIEIMNLKSIKKHAILKEWELLKEMLELRELWKMELLKPYAQIRYILLKISEKTQLAHYIFWLDFKEILLFDFDKDKAIKRLERSESLKNVSLPTILKLNELLSIQKSIGHEKNFKNDQIIRGTPLSPGMVFGEVRVVIHPETINTDEWPENVVLVAESTDPGWTGLFLKSKAIVVEKGGVLSHCAIVAREMGLPAISEISQCHLKFKDGDQVWVDGNNGNIKFN